MTYSERLARACSIIGLPPGIIATANIEHAPGCPILRGRRKCKCVPKITISTPAGQIEVLADGSIANTNHN